MKIKPHLSFPSRVSIGLLLAGLLTSSQAAQVFSPGLLKLEVYRDIDGSTVDDLRADPKYPDSPDEVHYVSRFEIPPSKYVPGNSGGIHVGQRLSGYIVPDQTANYVFYVSANEAGELWLAKDSTDPSTLELIATGTANYPARSYDTNTPSSPIRLEAGKRYYVEALMKEGGKEDLLAVAWTKENQPPPAYQAAPIAGQFLGILTDADTTSPSAITDLALDSSSTGMSYLWLNWTAPGDPGNTNTVAHYEVRYALQPITPANWTNATAAETVFFFPNPAGSREAFKVSDLNPGTTYYFAVRAQDAAGNLAPLSNVAQGRTQAATAGDIELIWDLEFNTAGADPTAKGDWKHRNPTQTAFNPATQVADGVLKCQSWNPILDTVPKDDFNYPFIIEVKLRCVDPLPDDTKMYDGACFFINMDALNGQIAKCAFSLQLLPDGTQQLNFMNSDQIITNYTGLSAGFHTVRWEVDPRNKKFKAFIDGTYKGTLPYERANTSDDRYATILGWGYAAEFDYVRIGRPAQTINARWDLEFDTAGASPTAKGDWKHRNPTQTAFDPSTQVANGLLKCQSWNPILDTVPKDDFDYPFIIEAKLRCVDPLPDDTKMYDGACFFINMDALNGQIAKCAFSLQLLPDGTQQLNFMNSDRIITNYTGLSPDFHTVRWEVDPPNKQFKAYIDGFYAGTLAYERANASDDRYATILGWGYAAEFDYVRIGTPISAPSPSAPSLIIVKNGSDIVISWTSSDPSFVLQTTASLSTPNWTKAGDATVQGENHVFKTAIGSGGYYRLKK